MRRSCAIALVVILAAVAMAVAFQACSKDTTKTAVQSAEAWLARVDAGEYGVSWDQAAAFFRSALSRDQWIASLNQVRKPLGKSIKRKLLGAQPMTDLPGVPSGEYVVIQFSTDFAGKSGAVETVTPMRESDGTWRVSGYYIK